MHKTKNCRYKPCGKSFQQYNSLEPYCSYQCKKKDKAIKHIKKVSSKREAENQVYSQLRKVFLSKPENKWCPVMLQLKNKKVRATTVHHAKGRRGKMLLNTKYWVALSMEGHDYVEKHPSWAKENGYSVNRLTINEQ